MGSYCSVKGLGIGFFRKTDFIPVVYNPWIVIFSKPVSLYPRTSCRGYSVCYIWRRKNMVMTAGARRHVGWLTHAVTTTCSFPPASNYTVATQYEGLRFQFNLFTLLDWLFGLFKKYRKPFKILNDCPFYTVTLSRNFS